MSMGCSYVQIPGTFWNKWRFIHTENFQHIKRNCFVFCWFIRSLANPSISNNSNIFNCFICEMHSMAPTSIEPLNHWTVAYYSIGIPFLMRTLHNCPVDLSPKSSFNTFNDVGQPKQRTCNGKISIKEHIEFQLYQIWKFLSDETEIFF